MSIGQLLTITVGRYGNRGDFSKLLSKESHHGPNAFNKLVCFGRLLPMKNCRDRSDIDWGASQLLLWPGPGGPAHVCLVPVLRINWEGKLCVSVCEVFSNPGCVSCACLMFDGLFSHSKHSGYSIPCVLIIPCAIKDLSDNNA